MFISQWRCYKALHRRGVVVSALVAAGILAASWFWLTSVVPYRERFTLYFSSSVHGLSVGSPVKLNGLDIGETNKIEIVSVPEEDGSRAYYAAVTVTLDTKALASYGRVRSGQKFGDALPQLIDLGLRGRLQMPSVLANGLCVALYFDPGKPAFSVNPPHAEYPEIPTNYTSSSEFVDQANAFIETRNLYGIAKKIRGLHTLISDIGNTVDAIDFSTLNKKTLAMLEKANAALNPAETKCKLADVNRKIETLCEDLEQKNELPRERAEELIGFLKDFSRTLREIGENARAIQIQLEPENVEIQRKLLQDYRKQLVPLIRFCEEVFF